LSRQTRNCLCIFFVRGSNRNQWFRHIRPPPCLNQANSAIRLPKCFSLRKPP
jgi:hypothetical protein